MVSHGATAVDFSVDFSVGFWVLKVHTLGNGSVNSIPFELVQNLVGSWQTTHPVRVTISHTQFPKNFYKPPSVSLETINYTNLEYDHTLVHSSAVFDVSIQGGLFSRFCSV